MITIRKLTERCYFCEEPELAIINPLDTDHWIVIDKGTEGEYSKTVFGPSVFEQCRVFVEMKFLGEL